MILTVVFLFSRAGLDILENYPFGPTLPPEATECW